MDIKAVIFDLDGTIIETGKLWIQSGLAANDQFGFEKPIDEIKSYIGTGKKDDYCFFVKNIFNEKIENGELLAKKGLFDFLGFLKANNIKIAVATSTKMEKVLKRLKSANIDASIFDQIVSGDIVVKNKPDPQVYLTACEMLKIKKENIIAIEDSDVGVKSATSAGLKTILIPDVVVPSSETFESAFKVFYSFSLLIDFINKNLNNALNN